MSETLRNTLWALLLVAIGALVAYPIGWRSGWNGAAKEAREARATEQALARPAADPPQVPSEPLPEGLTALPLSELLEIIRNLQREAAVLRGLNQVLKDKAAATPPAPELPATDLKDLQRDIENLQRENGALRSLNKLLKDKVAEYENAVRGRQK